MERKGWCRLLFVSMILGIVFFQSGHAEVVPVGDRAGNIDMKQVERGRYLSKIAGCNDCHTSGYMLSEGNVPEQLWLTGDNFGWRGPWGTTYAPNLRLLVSGITEEQWVGMARNLKTRPPMPWFNLNSMQEEDVKAIYQFIRYLGPGGEAAPAYVPPDQEPNTFFALFPSPPTPDAQ
jgi:mono/diheme cytochrome c family protein